MSVKNIGARNRFVKKSRLPQIAGCAAALAIAASASAAPAPATVTYSTFGDNYASYGGYLLSGSEVGYNNLAVPFIAPVTGNVTNITVGTDHLIRDGYDLTSLYGPPSHVVTLYSDTPNYTSYGGQSGSPGTSLFNFASPYGTVQNGSTNAYFSFDIADGPELIAGHQYWLGIISQGQYEQGQWRVSPTAPSAVMEHYVPSGGGYWAFTQSEAQPAFSITMTPEPAGLSVAAIAGVGLLRRRRRVR